MLVYTCRDLCVLSFIYVVYVFFFFCFVFFFVLMIRRPPRSTLDRSSAASDVYKRQGQGRHHGENRTEDLRTNQEPGGEQQARARKIAQAGVPLLSLIHISEPTRPY